MYAISIKFREMQSAPNSISTKEFLPPTADYKNTSSENLVYQQRGGGGFVVDPLLCEVFKCFHSFSCLFINVINSYLDPACLPSSYLPACRRCLSYGYFHRHTFFIHACRSLLKEPVITFKHQVVHETPNKHQSKTQVR